MGIFSSKKIELRKEYFTAHFNLSKDLLVSQRERDGFKVTLKNTYGDLYLEAKVSTGFASGFTITNIFFDNGRKECHLLFYGMDKTYRDEYLLTNFKKVTNYYNLPNGDELVMSHLTGLSKLDAFFLIVNENNPNSSAVILKK